MPPYSRIHNLWRDENLTVETGGGGCDTLSLKIFRERRAMGFCVCVFHWGVFDDATTTVLSVMNSYDFTHITYNDAREKIRASRC